MSSSSALPLPTETRWTRLANFWADYRQSPVAVAALIVVVVGGPHGDAGAVRGAAGSL